MIPIFLHIPKTGGATLNNCVCNEYMDRRMPRGPDEPACWQGGVWYAPSGFLVDEEPADLPLVQSQLVRPELRAVVGHHRHGIHRLLRPGTAHAYVTLLRDPVDRLASLHRHFLIFERPDLKRHRAVAARGRELGAFLANFDWPELANDQCRRLAGCRGEPGEADFARARELVERGLLLAGTTERFDESLLLLARRLRWRQPLQYWAQHVSADSGIVAEPVPAWLAEEIRERNSYDVLLHELASARLAAELEAEPDLAAQLAEFREHNERVNRLWREDADGDGDQGEAEDG